VANKYPDFCHVAFGGVSGNFWWLPGNFLLQKGCHQKKQTWIEVFPGGCILFFIPVIPLQFHPDKIKRKKKKCCQVSIINKGLVFS